MITTGDLHWAAGFLEGDGHFGWRKSARCPVIHASQKTREPLERLQRIFGGSICDYKEANNHLGGSGWQWTITARRAAAAMMTLVSLLTPSIKQDQVLESLKKWRAIPFVSRGAKAYGKR